VGRARDPRPDRQQSPFGQAAHHTHPVPEDEAGLAKKCLQNTALIRSEHRLTRKIRRGHFDLW
jgi:hypothetical protein